MLKKIYRLKKRIWQPKDRWVALSNYRIGICSLCFSTLGFLVTILTIRYAAGSFLIAQEQLHKQLEQINAKGKIDLLFNFTTSTMEIGPLATAPFELNIVPRNRGDYNSPVWAASILFCNDTEVLRSDSSWKAIDKKWFLYESKEKVLTEKNIFSDTADSIGTFSITLPGRKSISWEENQIPIGIFFTYGEKVNQVSKMVFLKLSGPATTPKFEYEDFRVNNETILTDLKGCLVMSTSTESSN